MLIIIGYFAFTKELTQVIATGELISICIAKKAIFLPVFTFQFWNFSSCYGDATFLDILKKAFTELHGGPH